MKITKQELIIQIDFMTKFVNIIIQMPNVVFSMGDGIELHQIVKSEIKRITGMCESMESINHPDNNDLKESFRKLLDNLYVLEVRAKKIINNKTKPTDPELQKVLSGISKQNIATIIGKKI